MASAASTAGRCNDAVENQWYKKEKKTVRNDTGIIFRKYQSCTQPVRPSNHCKDEEHSDGLVVVVMDCMVNGDGSNSLN